MSRYNLIVAMCIGAFGVSSALAEGIALRDVSADGTWDCKDEAGNRGDTIVVAETSYAFIKPDGKVGGYGKLNLIQMDDSLWLPTFVVTAGYLKDELAAVGLAMRGPIDNPMKLDGELYLNAVLGSDGKHYWDCVRRGGRDNAPPDVE